MFRIRRRIYLLLAPIVFFGGCTASIRLIWIRLEHSLTQDLEPNAQDFPVLVVDSIGRYSANNFDSVPIGSKIVIAGFDEVAINRDLNRTTAGTSTYPYFRLIEKTSTSATVSLEVPTLRDSELKSWYEIHDGQVTPKKLLRYGPGVAFIVLPWSILAGIASVAVFTAIWRPSRQGHSPATT